MSAEMRQKHELEVIDAVVRGSADARPEDAELVGFALSMRAARPLPDHGVAMRIDERVAKARSGRRQRRYPVWQLVAACACLLLVAGIVAVDRLETRTTGLSMAPKVVETLDSAPDATGRDRFVQEAQGLAGARLAGEPEMAKLAPSTRAPARKKERSATISLVAPPARFDRVADRISAVAVDAGGFVQTAKTRVSDQNRARGTFLLMIPVKNYRSAMAQLSRLGHVRSQSQGEQDITAEYTSVERTLKGRRSRTEALERQLQSATGDAERASLKRQLRRARIAERQAARNARSTRWRANYVPVDVRLGVDSNADNAGKSEVSKAFSRAGDILEKIAAALIVVLAVLLPVVIVALVLWWAARRWRRHRSDRVLAGAATQPE